MEPSEAGHDRPASSPVSYIDIEKQEFARSSTSNGSTHVIDVPSTDPPSRIRNYSTTILDSLRKLFCRTERPDLASRCIIPSLSDFDSGYPNLATYHSSSENFMVYRQFAWLQSRVLLESQDKLRLMEDELKEFDLENFDCATSREPNEEIEDVLKRRGTLISQIEEQLNSYALSLTTAQNLAAFNKPSDSEHRSMVAYLDNHKPVQKPERDFILHKHDLVTLRPGREHAWLDRVIEKVLQSLQRPLPFLPRLFCSTETQRKAGDSKEFDDVHYYTRTRIDAFAISLITIAILALLIVPIWLMYHLMCSSNNDPTGRQNAVCIGMLLVFTLLFSAVFSLFTRAKRHEILAAAAAYCAVLVVFLGNVRPN